MLVESVGIPSPVDSTVPTLHVTLGFLDKLSYDQLEGRYYKLANLAFYFSDKGSWYSWEVEGLHRQDGYVAHLTVAFFKTGEDVPPIHVFQPDNGDDSCSESSGR